MFALVFQIVRGLDVLAKDVTVREQEEDMATKRARVTQSFSAGSDKLPPIREISLFERPDNQECFAQILQMVMQDIVYSLIIYI